LIPAGLANPQADILHVTPKPDWQHVTTRGLFALRQAGLTATCEEIVKPTPGQLDQHIAARRPRIVFVHAFSVAASEVIRLTEKWSRVRFVVVSHSMENHVLTWPQYFGEMRLILDASRRLGNLQFAGSEDCGHWLELGYDVLRWHWPCALADDYSDPPTIDPPTVLIASRADIVKALPAQILAAAILQRRLGVRVLYCVNGEVGTRSKGLDDLTATAGLECERLGWVGYDNFLDRLHKEVSIVLQPSMSETFNYISWEAGSVGRPWVGSQAIKHTPPAWQVDPNDATQIARVAETILENYQNSSQKARQIAVEVASRNNAAYAEAVGRWIG
jgi:glycosyltransferase involved in cell wall biosynthesis